MLPQYGATEAHFDRRGREPGCRTCLAQASRVRVLRFDDGLVLSKLRMTDDLATSQDRRAGNVLGFQPRQPLRRAAGAQDVLREAQPLIDVPMAKPAGS